jgi:phosphotriesterase-related protein
MKTAKVNTVLGPVSADDLGVTLMHEHVIFGFPGWSGDCTIGPFDRDAALKASQDLFDELKGYGLKTFVDATPNETGRDPGFLKEVSEKCEVNIVCATGFYTEGTGASAYFKYRNMIADASEEIYEMFMREITDGIAGTGVKAGVIKLASSNSEITDYERLFFRAAARAQKETGVPIITHTQNGTMGPQQAQLLIDEGADPGRIMIGHMSDNTDIRYHMEVLKTGAYDAFDRMGLQFVEGCPMDEEKYPVILGLIAAGHADRIMISHDYIIYMLGRPTPERPDFLAELMKNYHPSHLFKNIIPMMKKAGVTDDQVNSIIIDNPRRLFSGQ